jgi:hypothetical protein
MQEGRISDEILEKFAGEGISVVRLRELLGRLDLQTRVLLSDDDSQPGKQAKREIALLLEGEPFVALRPIDELVDSLWMIVFNYAERQAEIDINQLTDDLLGAGLRRVWRRGYRPRAVDNFKGRQSEIEEITRIIATSAWTVIYGISGIGKTSVLSQLMSKTPLCQRNLVWIEVTPLTTPLSILAAISQTIKAPGISSMNNYLEASSVPDFRALVSALEDNSIVVVFDNFNAASDEVIALVEQLFVASGEDCRLFDRVTTVVLPC